jgi:hypothetical protein
MNNFRPASRSGVDDAGHVVPSRVTTCPVFNLK